MPDLTFEDYKQRVSIQDLLIDAGYTLNKRDGLRYPAYVHLDSNGKKIPGKIQYPGYNEKWKRAVAADNGAILYAR